MSSQFEENQNKQSQSQTKPNSDPKNIIQKQNQQQQQNNQNLNKQETKLQTCHNTNQQNQKNHTITEYIKQITKLNQTVITDISIRKGRTQKFNHHTAKLQQLKHTIIDSQNNYSKNEKSLFFQKISIVYYNLAKLGENQQSLENAITLLQQSQSCKFLVIRWKMQLAAMKSSSNHKAAYQLAAQTLHLIIKTLQQLRQNLIQFKPKLSCFISLVIKIIKSQKRNDFIWIHNVQNNLKFFTDYIWQLQKKQSPISIQNTKLRQQPEQLNQEKYQKHKGIYSTHSNLKKIEPFFPGYDFQIADYMSLQKLQINYIEKYNQQSQISEIVKQIVIYSSICCFTQATQNYYMGNYQLKYFHFKAIEIALLTVDKQCTYVGFLLKILNDYYGTKMSQIREQNSQIIEMNELRRRMPHQKRQKCMKNIIFAE